jgi:hypothetical protein
MKSELYWGLISSFIVPVIFCIINYTQTPSLPAPLDADGYNSMLSFQITVFIVIYFIVGVIMLFFKKSERFAKGLLLSALLLLAADIILMTRLIIIK